MAESSSYLNNSVFEVVRAHRFVVTASDRNNPVTLGAQ